MIILRSYKKTPEANLFPESETEVKFDKGGEFRFKIYRNFIIKP